MSSLKERVPPSARGPVGVASLLVGVAGLTVGYILAMVGVTLVLNLEPDVVTGLPMLDRVIVLAIGIGVLAVGYTGLRGFMYFSY